MSQVKSISIVVPLYNEEENVKEVYNSIRNVVEKLSYEYEIIFVDDGSSDKTPDYIRELAKEDSHLKMAIFKFNCGQTAAMQAGFDLAKNEVVIPMDGDMQNDPSDIPRLVEKIEEGYDVVSGWRKHRKDTFINRKLPSIIANKLISYIGKVPLHDYGCSLKAYRRDILIHITLYGEMHRFIPIYASWYGAKVTEIPVKHHPRTKGQSKYGISRTFKVVIDLITITFLGKYGTKPNHFFGSLGFISFFLSFLGGLYVTYKTIIGRSIFDSPVFHISIMSFLTGIQFFLMGLLGEVLIRTYHEAQNKRPYIIKEQQNIKQDGK